jgi:hypothetical protein
MTMTANAQDKITGPWLWMIAPTEANQGGANSTDVDSLSEASGGEVTEQMVAENGANEGDAVGDLVWTVSEISETGGNNVNDLVNEVGLGEGDVNDHSSYALITLVSASDQSGVDMRVGSDDSVKVWLNGAEVHNNPVNRGAGDFQDTFQVDLKTGNNLLLVKVSERGGGWSMFAGVDADVNAVYKAPGGVDGKITGPWLWMIAATAANEGGANSTDIDSLAEASGGDVTEDDVAANGASEGDAVGDLVWTLGEITDTGGNNVNDLVNEIGLGEGDVNDHSVYGLIILHAPEHQSGVPMKIGSDDSVKVWLNGEAVFTNAINRGRAMWQDEFTVNLVAGDNLLLVKIGERGGGWGMHVGIEADVTAVYKAPPPPIVDITGEWLWMIAPTEANQGGANSTDIDSLAVASNDEVTEAMVAENGAAEGGSVGDYDWILSELPENGDINAMLVTLGVLENTDLNDVSSYALITLVAEEAMEGVGMGVGSDDSIKVWLNGEVVHTNATNRGRGRWQDEFQVNLMQGDNLLLVKVSERGGGWGMYVGIRATVEGVYKSPTELGTAVEAKDKLVTTWGKLKSAK